MALRELGRELTPLEDVQETILAHVAPLPLETRRLAEAWGCVLRETVTARGPLPPFDHAAMDGYAVRAGDLEGASEARPVTLPVAGHLAAGGAPAGRLVPRSTVRIMTGAPVPPGAEAVVPHELTRLEAGGSHVSFFGPTRRGQNVRLAGGDLRPGDPSLEPGTVLAGRHLGLAAACGRTEVGVTRPLRVAILSPGSELVPPGAVPGPGQVTNSNALALAGLLREAGAEPADLGIVPDERDAILAALERARSLGADAVVSTGGVSAGDFDLVKAVVREHASPGFVFKVAMRPGKPQVFGLLGGTPLFGLPGNPAAAVISFEVLVRPALRKMRGESRVLPELFPVRFAAPYRYKPGRVFLLRARVEPDMEAGSFRVAPPEAQDSGFLAGLARANAIVRLPADRDQVAAGEIRPAFWLGGARP